MIGALITSQEAIRIAYSLAYLEEPVTIAQALRKESNPTQIRKHVVVTMVETASFLASQLPSRVGSPLIHQYLHQTLHRVIGVHNIFPEAEPTVYSLLHITEIVFTVPVLKKGKLQTMTLKDVCAMEVGIANFCAFQHLSQKQMVAIL